MKRQLRRVRFLHLATVVLVVSGFGCASVGNLLLQGGDLVEEDFKPHKVLVSYRAEGEIPKNTKYFLVETKDGEEAIWEKVENGQGALVKAYRETDKGDHFSGWVVGQPGIEFIIPKDRTKNAERYVYPVGKYKALRGSMAVVPLEEFQPVTHLIPE
jgi:hypothetical protein